MGVLDLAKRLIAVSLILLFGAIAISVTTQDAWLVVAHAAGIVSAVIAAIGVLLLSAAALRRLGLVRSQTAAVSDDHERGQVGWE